MASKTIKYKDFTSNSIVTVTAVESEPVEITTSSDDTVHSVKMISPNYSTTFDHVGGRPRDRG